MCGRRRGNKFKTGHKNCVILIWGQGYDTFFLIKKYPKNQGQRTAERRGGEAKK